jgi:hypothetical protein
VVNVQERHLVVLLAQNEENLEIVMKSAPRVYMKE